jgi:hypothetical protein
MGALPVYEDIAEHYGPYVDELREFLAGYSLRYGSPDDLLPVTARIRAHGSFPGDLGLVLRSILFRERGSISRARLLEILAVAIGGPRMERPPQQSWRPLSQLFDFITQVRRRPLQATSEGGQLIPFPATIADDEEDDDPIPLPDSPDHETSKIADFFLRIIPSPFPQWLSVLLIAAAGAFVIALFLMAVLRSSAHSQIRPHTIHAPPVSVHVAKPSAYGEAFRPELSVPLRRHRTSQHPTDAELEPAASVPPKNQVQASASASPAAP